MDVRKFESLKDAADRCVKELGAIDFVMYELWDCVRLAQVPSLMICYSAGAAGNFLASIEQLSVNAFKSVMDIDILGSYNTLKATLPYLVESGNKHRMDSESRAHHPFTCCIPKLIPVQFNPLQLAPVGGSSSSVPLSTTGACHSRPMCPSPRLVSIRCRTLWPSSMVRGV